MTGQATQPTVNPQSTSHSQWSTNPAVPCRAVPLLVVLPFRRGQISSVTEIQTAREKRSKADGFEGETA